MPKTISGSYLNGYDLANAALNPVTNTGTIAFGTSTNFAALQGETIAAWNVTNQGSISGGLASGVLLQAGGAVTNAAGAWIGGAYGVAIQGTAGTVTNFGTIDASAGSAGVILTHGGSVTNAVGGQILGGYGIDAKGDAGSVLNAGTIVAGTANAAIDLAAGGSVTNTTGGSLNGNWGIAIQDSSPSATTGTVWNYGTISGTAQSGVFLTGGTVTNVAGGRISGHWGVSVIKAAGTVITNGTIIGNDGTSVLLPAGYANRVVVEPGAVFTGVVEGGNPIGATVVSTLELAASLGAGTLSGFGAKYVDFGAVVFDPGAPWTLGGGTAGLAGTLAPTISGFAAGDTIEVTGVAGTLDGFNAGVLTLSSPSGPITLNLAGDFTGRPFHVTDVAAGTDITVGPAPCFRAGTRIATLRGEVAVEELRPGDRVRLADGGRTAPVVWLGHRRIACQRHPEPSSVWPIRVTAGAFGSGRPGRELWLSPDHAVFVDGVLIPVRCLLNGATIVQEQVAEVTYFHVELPAHEVILAEGLPCESYLDLGNRGAFDNGGGALLLHPDLATRIWQRDACAELILGGPKLAAARRRLIVEAAWLGHVATDDPALRLRVGRTLLRPEPAGLGLRFLVPSGTLSARLVSRTCIHADIQGMDTARPRGVAVFALLLDRQAIDLADRRLGAGWHAPAPGLRWTDGDARIAMCGAREILLMLAPTGPYWAEPRGHAARAA